VANIIEIETNMLNSDVSSLRSLIEDVRTRKNNLLNHMNELDGMWDGPANQEFIRQYQIDDAELSELCDALIRAVDCMEFAKTNYDSCEDEVSQIIASIN